MNDTALPTVDPLVEQAAERLAELLIATWDEEVRRWMVARVGAARIPEFRRRRPAPRGR
jgi:hypothetical protein